MWRYIPAPGAEAQAQSPEAQEVQEAQETPEDHATTSCVKLTADEESQSAGWLDVEDAAHERPDEAACGAWCTCEQCVPHHAHCPNHDEDQYPSEHEAEEAPAGEQSRPSATATASPAAAAPAAPPAAPPAGGTEEDEESHEIDTEDIERA